MYHVICVGVFLATGGGKREVESATRIVMRSPNKHGTSPMLFQCRASVEDVGPTLGEWHVFAEVLPLSIQQTQCWSSDGPVSLTICRH